MTVFADPDYASSALQPQRIIGRAVVRMPNITTAPTLVTSRVPLGGTVTSEMLIQVVPDFVDTGEGLLVHYDSTLTPSGFRIVDRPPTPEVVHDTSTALEFAPSTIVSPTFLGAEPMTFMERPVPRSEPGAVDPNRIFVDWPLSTRSQIGQLSRSLDRGDSFRLLYDPTCAPRSRPTCLTGGGGDTESEVNLVTGMVLFSDQEGVANEAVASSVDHGDTFPIERQFALTNATTGTDRQWLAWSDPEHASFAGRRIEGFLAYHLPAAGQYVQGIDENGVVIPQPVPQIALVSQSGPLRVDNTDGPGRGWIYQSYRDSNGYKVGVAPAADWQDPTAWSTSPVSSDQPAIFPWLALDSRGNAYAVWVTGGIVFLSVSNIDDPRNDPAHGGRPGSSWTAKVRITPPSIRSSVFPVVAAGDAGRIAIAYMGSEDCLGANGQPVPNPVVSDTCGVASHWRTYTAIVDDALALHRGTPARIVTGEVSHRVVHRGSVCTSGTTCTGDRSLLDMIDVGVDAAGRVGVVFMDNNNRLATPNETDNAKNGPFVQFAKQVAGPSLLAEGGDHTIAIPENARDDSAGDATWPNRAGSPNLGALDIRGAAIGVDGEDIVVRLRLGDTSAGAAAAALERVNAVRGTDVPAERLQHVVRFSTGFDIWHLSLETLADGTRRAFGGRLDANDGQVNPASPTAILAAGYHTDALPVTAGVGGGIVTLRARAADLGLALGDRLTSVSAFAIAGPAESVSLTAATPMRTIDANPPFDATLAELAVEDSAIDCADDRVIRSGGWAVLEDARAGEGTLCRANVKSDGGAPTIELRFDGDAVDVVVATGPRGGQLDLSVDGGSPTRVDLYRAPSDPDNPDNSGRKDLTFGVAVRVMPSDDGPHTLRVRPASGQVEAVAWCAAGRLGPAGDQRPGTTGVVGRPGPTSMRWDARLGHRHEGGPPVCCRACGVPFVRSHLESRSPYGDDRPPPRSQWRARSSHLSS